MVKLWMLLEMEKGSEKKIDVKKLLERNGMGSNEILEYIE